MDIALGIVSLEPKGGLQRDCLNIARILYDRGHQVTIFTSRPALSPSDPLKLTVLAINARTNHGRDLAFAKAFQAASAGRFERIVGFNKLPGLELLFCADPSVHDKKRAWWVRLLRRHMTQRFLEGSCFGEQSRTHIMLLSQAIADSYVKYWNTPLRRLRVLPAVADPRRNRPYLREPTQREAIRRGLELSAESAVWLWVGTKPDKKGLDRVVTALEHITDSFLLIVGPERSSKLCEPVISMAQRAKLDDRMRFLGYREDIPELMAAADVLAHPARLEVTGQVILEALMNGLPVVTSERCGFAPFVREAMAGIVLREPFQQQEFELALRQVTEASRADSFSRNALAYARNQLSMPGLETAANIIEAGPRAGFHSLPESAPSS